MNTNKIENALTDLENEWGSVSESMRGKIGEAAFQSWIKPITISGLESGVLRIS